MTPHFRSPDRRGVGYPPRTGSGLAGSGHIGIDGSPEVGMAGGSNGIGGAGLRDVGTVDPAGTGGAGSSIRLRLSPGRSGPSATGPESPAGSGRSGATGIGPTTGNSGSGATGIGPTAGNSGAGVIGGVPPGLVQRVQRHLAAAGAVAADSAGLQTAVTEALREDGILLPAANLAPIVRAIGDELTGLGPLAPLLADPTVTDVLVNGPTDVWVERAGSIERAAVRFTSAAAVAAMVQRVVAPLGLRVDESRPWVDARLPGGERFHAVLPPLAPTARWSPSARSPGAGSSSAT